jgi:hypothetical protein
MSITVKINSSLSKLFKRKKFAGNRTLQNFYNKVAIIQTASEFPELVPLQNKEQIENYQP